MSRAEYMRKYREDKANGTFVDKRIKEFPTDNCLNCGEILYRERSNRPRLYCHNDKCQHEHARKTAVDLGIAGTGSTKRYLIETRGHKCERCNNTEWLGEPIPLELHHLKDFNNNSPECTQLLCPNCHSKTDNYKARNHGNGRLRNKQTPKPFYQSLSDLPHLTGT